MKVKIWVDTKIERDENGDFISTPIYKEFTDMNEANIFIQEYCNATVYNIVCVKKITDELIELVCDIIDVV